MQFEPIQDRMIPCLFVISRTGVHVYARMKELQTPSP